MRTSIILEANFDSLLAVGMVTVLTLTHRPGWGDVLMCFVKKESKPCLLLIPLKNHYRLSLLAWLLTEEEVG